MKLKRKVGQKGQVVIPKDLREEENIRPNTKVYFTKRDHEIVIKKPRKNLSDLFKEMSEEEMEKKPKSSDESYEQEMKERAEKAGIE